MCALIFFQFYIGFLCNLGTKIEVASLKILIYFKKIKTLLKPSSKLKICFLPLLFFFLRDCLY
jgi:hypothetical protein